MTKPTLSGQAPAQLAKVLRAGVAAQTGTAGEVLPKLLNAIRVYLGMEAAFVAQIEHGRRIFRVVDAEPGKCALPVGGSDPAEESYCQRVIDGRLPELMQNAQEHPAACELPVTFSLPVGAHLSIPLRLPDGRTYGTFCCFSRVPDYSLNLRDLELVRTFADIATTLIARDLLETEDRGVCRRRVRSVLEGQGLSMVYQPIVNLESDRIVGFESLARFSPEPLRTPDLWFEEASRVGLGDELEALAIEQALARGHLRHDVYVACNVSPEVVLHGNLPAAFCKSELSKVVLEITEHTTVEDYDKLEHTLRPLRRRGLRLSVDDAGAGYASFRHILRLRPDYIKLDVSLTRDIDRDGNRRALAAAISGFARETGSVLIAEGVETPAELATLRQLGIHKAQGFLLGRPAPFDAAQKLVEEPVAVP